MWVLRQYDRRDDEMRLERPLPGLTAEVATELLGSQPTKLGSTPLGHGALIAIARQFGLSVLTDQHIASFLDYDAESRADTAEVTSAADTRG